MNSNLCYTGMVTIKSDYSGCKKEIIRHNVGTEHLFKVFAKCLAGYDVSKDVPVAIDIVDDNDNSILDYLYLFTGTVYTKKDNHWVTRYTTIIPKSKLQTINANLTYSLHLCDRNSNVLASLTFTEAEVDAIANLDNDMQLLIEWELTVTNKEDINT